MRRRPSLVLVPLMLALALPAAGGSAGGAEAAFLTISFGRTQWQPTEQCLPLAGGVTLDTVAADMAARGATGTGNVIVNRTRETGFLCVSGYMREPGWDRLAMLRDTYGWSFVSAGATYHNMTTLTPEEQLAESCGSLDAFSAHGHDRAWGLFAYPNNKWTVQIQTDVVQTCFAYGRKYGGSNVRTLMAPPWFAATDSVGGGSCSVTTLACYSVNTAPTARYRSPVALAAKTAVASGRWVNLQFYRFVTGANGTPTSGTGARWDCTGADWRTHWTSKPEIYCYGDFLQVIDAIPDTVTVTDPATVAEAWGRTPGA